MQQKPTRAAFPYRARLHRPSEFACALRGRRIGKGALFVVTAPREQSLESSCPRLGLVIAKRFAAKAVTRNTIKRVIRESFRAQRNVLFPDDYVFRLHSRVGPISLSRLKKVVRDEADTLLGRAHR